MRTRVASMVILVVAALLTGCMSTHTPAGAAPAAVIRSTTTEARPAWTLKVDLIGEPVVRHGVIASYVRVGRGGLEVRAWQLADGTELWRMKAEVGHAAQGETLDLAAVHLRDADGVAFLAVSRSWHPYELVVVDLATGTRRSIRDPAVVATSHPSACDDDVCFEGWALDTNRNTKDSAKALRVDLRSGRIREAESDAIPEGAFGIGPQLFALDPKGTGAQRLGRAVDGTVTWTEPYASVFGTGATTAGGWQWTLVRSTLIGVGGRPGVVVDGHYRVDLGDTSTVALDAGTGRVKWRLAHVSPCGTDDLDTWGTQRRLVLCRTSGSVATPVKVHPTVKDSVYRDVRVTMIGVDLETGGIRWRRSAPAALGESSVSATSNTRWVPLRDGATTLLLDRITGVAAALPAGASVACSAPRDALEAPDSWNERKPGDYNAGTATTACGGGRRLSRYAVTSAGVDGENGWWVVPGETTLSAYQLGD